MWKWETEGDAKGVIVIIHGAMEHHGRYKWVTQMWLSAGYHVVTGDLPGQGMTTRAYRGHIDSFDEYLDEVKSWMRRCLRIFAASLFAWTQHGWFDFDTLTSGRRVGHCRGDFIFTVSGPRDEAPQVLNSHFAWFEPRDA